MAFWLFIRIKNAVYLPEFRVLCNGKSKPSQVKPSQAIICKTKQKSYVLYPHLHAHSHSHTQALAAFGYLHLSRALLLVNMYASMSLCVCDGSLFVCEDIQQTHSERDFSPCTVDAHRQQRSVNNSSSNNNIIVATELLSIQYTLLYTEPWSVSFFFYLLVYLRREFFSSFCFVTLFI